MGSVFRRVLRPYMERICVCDKCGKRVRIGIGKEAMCPHCRKRMRTALRTY